MHEKDMKALFEKFPWSAIADLPIKDIKVDKMIQDESLEMRDEDFGRLNDSLKRHGVLEPITVTKDGYIIDGLHRFSSAKSSGKDVIICKILKASFKDYQLQDWLDYAALVNIVRRNQTEDYIRLALKEHPTFFSSEKEMSSKKPTKEVSVKKLAEEAKIARSTFRDKLKRIRKGSEKSDEVKLIVEQLELPNKASGSKKEDRLFISPLHGFADCHTAIFDAIDQWMDELHAVTSYRNPMQYVKVNVRVEMLPFPVKEKKGEKE